MKLGIDINYFMYEMSISDNFLMSESFKEQYIDSWENTRMLMYSIFQTQSTKRLKPTDVIQFVWDEKKVVKADPNYNREQAIREADNILDLLATKKIEDRQQVINEREQAIREADNILQLLATTNKIEENEI